MYITNTTDNVRKLIEELEQKLMPYLTKYDLSEMSKEHFRRMVEITREPLVLLSDITDAVEYFFGGSKVYVQPEVQEKYIDTEFAQAVLNDFVNKSKDWEFTEEFLHEKMEEFRAYWKEQGHKAKETMWVIRGAVTGRTFGADMNAIMVILGKENTLARINASIKSKV